MNQREIEPMGDRTLLDLDTDKDTWIYTYGSPKLQEIRSYGYECEEPYLKERLATEYPGFKINAGSSARKLDYPPLYAVRESLKWPNACVSKQNIHGEVLAIDNYLGKYQIIKKTRKPWYLASKNLSAEARNCGMVIFFTIFISCFWTILFTALG
jgi:hypothetical protein